VIKLTIGLDTRQLAELDRFKDQNVKTATAKAMTFTAKDAQAALKAETAGVFHLRRNWVPQGIRIKPANSGNLQAQVGSIDKYMERHVIGAKHPTKKPARPLTVTGSGKSKRASGGILIKPYDGIGSAEIHTVVRRKLKQMDGTKRKLFVITAKSGKVMLVRRKTKKRMPLQVVAMLEDHVETKEVWNFYGTVKGVVDARFEGHFLRALAKYAPK
jgi:hypothetical protein